MHLFIYSLWRLIKKPWNERVSAFYSNLAFCRLDIRFIDCLTSVEPIDDHRAISLIINTLDNVHR